MPFILEQLLGTEYPDTLMTSLSTDLGLRISAQLSWYQEVAIAR
jgi:hypothetical protein